MVALMDTTKQVRHHYKGGLCIGALKHALPAQLNAAASFTLNEESLAGCVALAKELQVGVHIHVAEDLW